MSKKIEYKTVALWELKSDTNAICVDKLNLHGQNGWELVTILGGTAIFKKRK